MPTATYRFTRGPLFVKRQNRASTVAFNAVTKWANNGDGRRYDLIEDGEDQIVAKLRWRNEDDSAGSDLDQKLSTVDIDREHIESL